MPIARARTYSHTHACIFVVPFSALIVITFAWPPFGMASPPDVPLLRAFHKTQRPSMEHRQNLHRTVKGKSTCCRKCGERWGEGGGQLCVGVPAITHTIHEMPEWKGNNFLDVTKWMSSHGLRATLVIDCGDKPLAGQLHSEKKPIAKFECDLIKISFFFKTVWN